MLRFLYILALISSLGVFTLPSEAQTIPHIKLNSTYGGVRNDEGYAVVQTGDSGFAVAGYTGDTTEPGLPDYHGGFEDAWFLRLDTRGNIIWEKCLGGSNQEECNSMVQTRDGGYCLAIRTESRDGDVIGGLGGGSDGWVVKLAPSGSIEWQKIIGGTNWDDVYSIVQTRDGGYAVAGYTTSSDGTVTGHHGGDSIQNDDAWVTKLDANGKVEWSKCYGGLETDWAEGIVQTPDGGYCFTGFTLSNDGDVSGDHNGSEDLWVVKLDSIGRILWQHCYGGSLADWGSSIGNTSDSGFIITGGTYSNDGDVSGNHGSLDAWVLKLDKLGNLQWEKTLGGDTVDKGWSVRQVSDGGYIMAGMTQSLNGDVVGNHGKPGDAWLVKLSSSGSLEWQKCLGGSNLDVAFFVTELSNGDLAFVGQTESSDGDIILNHGGQDFWFVTLTTNTAGITENHSQPSVSLYPNPANRFITVHSDASENVPIAITNVLGQTLYRGTTLDGNDVTINTSNFLPGCYLLTVMAPNDIRSVPFEIAPQN